MTRKKGLEAVRASLDSIFSPEGLKNIQLLREGTLTSLPEDSFKDSSEEEPFSSVASDTATQSADTTRHHNLPIRHGIMPAQPAVSPRQLANLPREPAAATCRYMVPHQSADTNQQVDSPRQLATSTCRVNSPLPSARQESAAFIPSKLHVKSAIRTKAQARMLSYLEQTGSHITNYQLLQEETGIPVRTVRDIFAKFTALGWMEKTPWAEGSMRGIKIVFYGTRPVNSPTQSAVPICHDNLLTQIAMTTCHDTLPTQPAVSSLEEREKRNLSFPLEDCQLHWPKLFRCGFGPSQLAQIMASLSRLGKSTDRVVQGLDHIEYELTHGQLVDKEGQAVADPCSWAFRALAQNGYYRRPKGYVSPEEQAVLDQEEEARALQAARKKAEQARFEVWRDGLSPEALAQAMAGHPGGPKDAWLKRVWLERGDGK